MSIIANHSNKSQKTVSVPKLNTVILLQIVMVGPGTHLEKNHESQSRTIESQFKRQRDPECFVTTQLI